MGHKLTHLLAEFIHGAPEFLILAGEFTVEVVNRSAFWFRWRLYVLQ
jgi:hypothetical protein